MKTQSRGKLKEIKIAWDTPWCLMYKVENGYGFGRVALRSDTHSMYVYNEETKQAAKIAAEKWIKEHEPTWAEEMGLT